MSDNPFEQYVEHGWALVPVEPGVKGPRTVGWNLLENCVTTVAQARTLRAAGLGHKYSKTCAIDVDDLQLAITSLKPFDVDLKGLLAAPDAVRIERGDPNRTKLIYACAEPLVTLKPFRGLELRCASRSGRTVQDVLPPSPHPSGSLYRWVYNDELIADWRAAPDVPEELRAYWEGLLAHPSIPEDAAQQEDESYLTKLLDGVDPDCGYDDWIRVGMALHHASNGTDAGLQLWDRWSSQGAKYQGFADLRPHWGSFVSTGSAPVTVNTLKAAQVATFDDFEEIDPWDAAAAVEDATAAEQYAFTPIAEWVTREPPKWLVEGLLPQADIAMVYGATGSGKTFWALDLALTIAAGRQWRDNATVAAAVCWIAAEAAGSVRNRALAYAADVSMSLDDIDLHVTGAVPDLSNPATVKSVIVAILEVKPAIVVIDTLVAASGGANENSGEDMNAVMSACRAMHKATGALILLIHHSGKDASRGARGWSGLKAAVDTEIEIVEMPEGARSACVTKQRDGESGASYGFFLRQVGDSCVVDHSDYQASQHSTAPAPPVKGYVQEIVYKQALNMLKVGENRIEVEDLLVSASQLLTAAHTSTGRDQRRDRTARSIDRMIAAGIFEREGDDVVLVHVGFDSQEF